MARLKKTSLDKPTPPTAPEPLPEHVRVLEWGELKSGDPVMVSFPGKQFRRNVHWTFFAYVTAPGGTNYVDVYERKSGEPHGLWRSFKPEQVTAKHIPKKRVSKSSI